VSQLSAQLEITARIKTIQNIDVYEGLSSDEVIALVANTEQIKPFVVVSYGGMIRPRKGTNGITGSRASSNIMEFTTRCVASTYDNARRVNQDVWDAVMGFVPTNAGEIDSVLYGGVGEVSALGNPTRYASVQSYACLVNSDYS
jgi:hypothetical protein